VAAKDRRWCHSRVPEVRLPFATAFLQVFANLFAVHIARYTKARRVDGRSYGSVADTPLQPILEGRVRPVTMKRNAWNA